MRINQTKGFTLVETLVAITILMVAIAGPMTIATKGYSAALDSKNEMIGANLAQEGIEYLNNIKDNGVWPPGGSNCISTNNTPICGVGIREDFGSLSTIVADLCTNINNCVLKRNENYGYGYSDAEDWKSSAFTRKYYLAPVADETVPADAAISQYLATVIVSWYDGSALKEIRLQEFLTNAIR